MKSVDNLMAAVRTGDGDHIRAAVAELYDAVGNLVFAGISGGFMFGLIVSMLGRAIK